MMLPSNSKLVLRCCARLCGVQRVFGGSAKRTELAAMFRFMLQQVMEHPFGGHIVGGELPDAPKLVETHGVKHLEESLANGGKSVEVLVKRDAVHLGQMPMPIPIIVGK